MTSKVVHIYKRKGDRAVCDNHRGISLLSIAGKVLARVLLNRLNGHVNRNSVIPESQCGFRHELCCKTNTGEVSRTSPGSTHGVYKSHKGA